MQDSRLRHSFAVFNRWFMVPAFRLGLGPVMGNPFTGYIMVVKTIGRKTGAVRSTPVNYAIINGDIYCLSGWGRRSHWYRNLKARPDVELLLPSGPLTGVAAEVADPEEAARAIRQILKNAGFAGFFFGFNPFTVSDDVLREKTRSVPVLRIRPTGIGSGAGDPGGWLWVLVWGLIGIAFWLIGRRPERR